ncbi:glycosyltransferase family A protein [Microbispora sp. KK1-11]|uniref:glycosyltransferase family A protein n=1 Tax=Microbispora sp. KK1-11 TaxID=2053005 RepID=UPI0011577168|nr:glycosyltransferase family A protein [Microbispora sp. KK1-11]TQS28821.1 glycosyltransferase [Microbispora sp. KK1-11]
MSEVSEPAAGQPERSDPAALRQALAEAVERASGAAELARLISDYQRRLEEVARSEAEALTKMREAEARLKTAERQNAQLAKQLAEQKYQTEVANWKLASLQESRWSKLGDAIHSKNPGSVARTLKAPIRKRPAPKRSDFKPEIPAVPEVKAAPAAPEPKAPQVSAPLAESFVVPKGPTARPYMTVAAIVDRQTEALLRYEWRLVTNFGPDNWEAMLDQQRPHVLFVESVRPGPRQGNGGRWLEALAGETRALRDLVAACHKRGVKTVFWHSGGAVSRAVPAAEHFEYVLATTEARAREWRSALRHDRVGVLPHAIQPRVHNPIPAEGGRTGEIVTLGTVTPPAGGAAWQPLAGQDDDTTAYDDVLTAYRQPALVIAGADAEPRVIGEVAACGTPVLQVRAGAKGEEILAAAEILMADAGRLAREAHLAWRARTSVTPLLDPVLDTLGVPSVRNSGVITAITAVSDPAELDRLLAQVTRQVERPGQIVIVADGLDAGLVDKTVRQACPDLDVVVRATQEPITRGAALDRAIRLADGDYVAVLDARDLYGEHYLADLVRHFASTDAEVLGKASFYAHLPETGATLLRQPGAEHRFLPEVAGGTVLARRQILTDLGFADVSEEWGEVLMRQCRTDGVRVYSADRYSYVCVRDSAEGSLLGSAQMEGYVPAEPLALL